MGDEKNNDKEFENFLRDSNDNSEDMRDFIFKAIKEKILLLNDMIQKSTVSYCKLPKDSKIKDNFEYFIVRLMNVGMESFDDFEMFTGSIDENYEERDGDNENEDDDGQNI